ncbi:hypothetical protein BKA93DRAFT_544072, partial [Sparassis latifolia]
MCTPPLKHSPLRKHSFSATTIPTPGDMQLSTAHDKSFPSNRPFEPPPNDLRLLVLDYLCHNSYSNAARSFLRDSAVKHLDADGDEIMSPVEKGDELLDTETFEERLSLGELRKDIRILILSGQVDEATVLLNKHFPSVLSEDAEILPASKTIDHLEWIPSTSVDPTHLALNLRILAFIEASRTVPLPYYLPGTKPSTPPIIADRPGEENDPAAPEGDSAEERQLHRAQNLYAEANRLPSASDRALYLHELGRVSALLAYRVPESGPTAEYMTPERREAVANQIESAILYRLGQPTTSKIELSTRYTSVLWSALHDMNVKSPPPSAWPVGLSLPRSLPALAPTGPTGKTAGSDITAARKKAGVDADTRESVPRFDLHAFL